VFNLRVGCTGFNPVSFYTKQVIKMHAQGQCKTCYLIYDTNVVRASAYAEKFVPAGDVMGWKATETVESSRGFRVIVDGDTENTSRFSFTPRFTVMARFPALYIRTVVSATLPAPHRRLIPWF